MSYPIYTLVYYNPVSFIFNTLIYNIKNRIKKFESIFVLLIFEPPSLWVIPNKSLNTSELTFKKNLNYILSQF